MPCEHISTFLSVLSDTKLNKMYVELLPLVKNVKTRFHVILLTLR